MKVQLTMTERMSHDVHLHALCYQSIFYRTVGKNTILLAPQIIVIKLYD